MRVILHRQNAAVHFVATTESGHTVSIDGSPGVGGEDLGARPSELLLAALGGCSGIDVSSILAKQRQPADALTVTVDGEREQVDEVSLLRAIHVHFDVTGNCQDAKVARAVELSMRTYCSVARILERTATITHSYTIRAGAAPGDTAPSPAPATAQAEFRPE